MNLNSSILKYDEKASYALRSLYQKYGYKQYKMNKFEEYELYLENKDFLISDNIITFTDTNNKLMALKPDVTLSIIKNLSKENSDLQKLFYTENVYRISDRTKSFKEIMQVGLECIGNIDTYCIFEVLKLAAESLKSISEEFILDISHLDILSGLIDSLNTNKETRKNILKCIAEKNIHELEELSKSENLDLNIISKIEKLILSYGTPSEVIAKLKKVIPEYTSELTSLEEISNALENSGFKGKINIDFSVINNMKYYNGFVFKGFINGISSGVLSGGQYGKFMQKTGKAKEAIGFAVYIDLLERLEEEKENFDVETVLLYDETVSLNEIEKAIINLAENNSNILAFSKIPNNLKYKKALKLTKKGVEIIGNNA